MATLNIEELVNIQGLLLSCDYLATLEKFDNTTCIFRLPDSLKMSSAEARFSIEYNPTPKLTKTVNDDSMELELPAYIIRPTVMAAIYGSLRWRHYRPDFLFCFEKRSIHTPIIAPEDTLPPPPNIEDLQKENVLLDMMDSLKRKKTQGDKQRAREYGLELEYETLKNLFFEDGSNEFE